MAAPYINNKIKLILGLSNYATKNELDDATGLDASYLAAKRDFIALKAEVHKQGINELFDVPTDLNNLKIEVDDLDVGKIEIVPVDWKKLSAIVSKEIMKNTKVNKLNTKVNNLEKKKS